MVDGVRTCCEGLREGGGAPDVLFVAAGVDTVCATTDTP